MPLYVHDGRAGATRPPEIRCLSGTDVTPPINLRPHLVHTYFQPASRINSEFTSG